MIECSERIKTRIDAIIITTVYWEDNNSNKLVPGAFDTVYYEYQTLTI